VSADGYTDIGQLAWRILGTAGATGSVLRGIGYDLPTGRVVNLGASTPSTFPSANVQNDNYTYANTGDVTAVQDVVANQRQCFTYDGLDRLTLAGTTPSTATGCTPDMTTAPQPYKEAYTYDDDGNLTALTRNTSPTTITTTKWAYGNATLGATALKGGPHAPTLVTTGTGTTAVPPTTFTPVNGYTYDTAGRLTTKTTSTGATTSTNTWNALGQLAAVAGAANGDTYGPDATRWVRVHHGDHEGPLPSCAGCCPMPRRDR
jgi:YD repeat-containing protein